MSPNEFRKDQEDFERFKEDIERKFLAPKLVERLNSIYDTTMESNDLDSVISGINAFMNMSARLNPDERPWDLEELQSKLNAHRESLQVVPMSMSDAVPAPAGNSLVTPPRRPERHPPNAPSRPASDADENNFSIRPGLKKRFESVRRFFGSTTEASAGMISNFDGNSVATPVPSILGAAFDPADRASTKRARSPTPSSVLFRRPPSPSAFDSDSDDEAPANLARGKRARTEQP